MFYVWAEYSTGPVSLQDAGSTLFSDDATEADFADYAKDRGFTVESERCSDYGVQKVWHNRNERSFIAILGVEGDSYVAARAAGYAKRAGLIGGN